MTNFGRFTGPREDAAALEKRLYNLERKPSSGGGGPTGPTGPVGPTGPTGPTSDTGWITLSSTVVGAWGIQYRCVDSVVTVIIEGLATAASGTTYVLSTTAIPSAYCPPTIARGGGFFDGYAGVLAVTATGEVTAIQRATSSTTTVSATITYLVPNAAPSALIVGNPGNLTLSNGTLQNSDSLNIVAGIDGQVVTASASGILTKVYLGLGTSPSISSSSCRIVTGSLVGTTFTVTGVSASVTVPSGTSQPALLSVAVPINAGDYIALYQPAAGTVTEVAYNSTANANNKHGYRASVGGVPTPGAAIVLTGIYGSFAIEMFGTDI